jgi:hypothetical protein
MGGPIGAARPLDMKKTDAPKRAKNKREETFFINTPCIAEDSKPRELDAT